MNANQVKYIFSLVIAFALGAICHLWDLPSPAPPMLLGAGMVMAMTSGFMVADKLLGRKDG
jgi:XapX domain-containing protein